jgi:glutathione S-transferase
MKAIRLVHREKLGTKDPTLAAATHRHQACFVLRLITIPISHYCEKARWALDLSGQRYQEDAHLPLFHRAPARRAGGRRTVPVLVTPEGTLSESTDIVRWADQHLPEARRLFSDPHKHEVERWVEELDAEFGVDTRLWAYAVGLSHKSLIVRYGFAGAPRWQQFVATRGYGVLKRLMTRFLGISDASVAHAVQRVDRTLDRVDALLADGRPFLLGDRFSAADLTFASLASAILAPPEYHVTLPGPDEFPATAATRMRDWRARPAGQHALRMFREYRRAR